MKRKGTSSRFLLLLGSALIVIALAVLCSLAATWANGRNANSPISKSTSAQSLKSQDSAASKSASASADSGSAASKSASASAASASAANKSEPKENAASTTASASVSVPRVEERTYEETLGVDEGYQLVVYRGDYGQFVRELSAVLRARIPHVCIENYQELSHSDLYACDYGAFWVEDWSSYQRAVCSNAGDDLVFLHIDFTYSDVSDSELSAMMGEIDTATQQILSKVSSSMDTWTTAKAVHDELVARINYDQEKLAPHTYDLYGALVLCEATCTGYSCAFMYLMNKLGYSAGNMTSETHAWSFVNGAGADKYVDPTWDDYDLYDSFGRPYIAYDYFFLTYEEMQAAGQHDPAEPTPNLGDESTVLGWSYHVHEGCYFESFDLAAMEAVMRRQYESGGNCLYLRFADDASFQSALAWLENAAGGVGQTLASIGYTQPYHSWYEDLERTITIGLYAQK